MVLNSLVLTKLYDHNVLTDGDTLLRRVPALQFLKKVLCELLMVLVNEGGIQLLG